MTKLNLDQLAAQTAQAIVDDPTLESKAKETENLLTKALGVLQEQGVYAGMLFLYSRTSSDDIKVARVARRKLIALLTSDKLLFYNTAETPSSADSDNAQKILKFYADRVCDNLEQLLVVKDLYEQTLIYARYGAKAARKDSDNG